MRISMKRRDFLKSLAASAAILPLRKGMSEGINASILKDTEVINKRKLVLDLLESSKEQKYIPAGFFIHFDEQYHTGQAAINKHLEYFRYTQMDFVKIQYESTFPHLPDIKKPKDWMNMPLYKRDFYADQLDVVAGLVKETKKEALVIVTLYSPFMCAGHTSTNQLITEHIKENPEQVKKGMEIITESKMLFVKECIKAGVDGFYASTQGGENNRFDDIRLFNECIKPYDLTIMEEINTSCIFNILHICDWHGGYDDLAPFLDYPGDVVNCSQKLGNGTITPIKAAQYFNRPYMGGIDKRGVIASGDQKAIKQNVETVLKNAPGKFILGADCTLPNNVNWENIKTAITTAHNYQQR